MNKNQIRVETVGRLQANSIDRLAEAIRRFYADPKNVKAFNKWKKGRCFSMKYPRCGVGAYVWACLWYWWIEVSIFIIGFVLGLMFARFF